MRTRAQDETNASNQAQAMQPTADRRDDPWYGEPDAISNAISYAKFFSRSHDAVIRFYDKAGNVIETHEHAGDFKEW